MNLPLTVGILGIAAGIALAIVGLLVSLRQAGRRGAPSLVGLRLQVVGLAVIILTFGIDIVVAAAGLGLFLAAMVGFLMIGTGAGVVFVAARLRVRDRSERP